MVTLSKTGNSRSKNPLEPVKGPDTLLGMTIIGLLFFIFGFVTWLNATLIPYLELACNLKYEWQAYLVTFAFYISYFVMALPSSYILKKTRLKNGMMLGLWLMSAGALLFIPAALTRTYELFLLGLFVCGSGLAVLQTAANPYVIILGPPESAAQRVSIMGICNKLAGALSPLILGAIVLKDYDVVKSSMVTLNEMDQSAALNSLAAKAIVPYVIIAVSLFLLGLFVRFSALPNIEEPPVAASGIKGTQRTSIFHFPHLWLGVMALFVYVGVEVVAIDTITKYGTSDVVGFSMDQAKRFPTFAMFGLMIGYVIGIISIPRWISQQKALTVCAAAGIIFTVCALITSGPVSIWFIALLSMANALMWPAIFPLAIFGLGRFTKIGSALLIMAIAGGAVMPLLYSLLSTKAGFGPQLAYSIAIPCYLIIGYFSVWGHRAGLSVNALASKI